MIAMAGAATGIAIVAAAVGASQECGGGPTEPVSPPVRLPDYRATIQAPTPTQDPQLAPGDRTVWVDDTDVDRLKQWMRDRAWLAAVATTTGGDPVRLTRFLEALDGTATCHGAASADIDGMAASGNLLGDTSEVTRRATECLENALSQPESGDKGVETKPAALSALLTAQSSAANPVTAITAAEPSPQNMAAWRTIWPHQEECRARIPALAASAARARSPEETEDAVRQAFIEIEGCLQTVALRMTAPTP